MKNINDVCVVIQARLTSERVPNKMAKPFGQFFIVLQHNSQVAYS